MVVELSEKDKRAKNTKIKAELLKKISQFKAELAVPMAFGQKHWAKLLLQMSVETSPDKIMMGGTISLPMLGQSRE